MRSEAAWAAQSVRDHGVKLSVLGSVIRYLAKLLCILVRISSSCRRAQARRSHGSTGSCSLLLCHTRLMNSQEMSLIMRCILWAKPSLRTIMHSITHGKASFLLLHHVKPLMSNLWIAVLSEHTGNSDITMHANTRRHERQSVTQRGCCHWEYAARWRTASATTAAAATRASGMSTSLAAPPAV